MKPKDQDLRPALHVDPAALASADEAIIRQVAAYRDTGRTQRQIAQDMGISRHRVRKILAMWNDRV